MRDGNSNKKGCFEEQPGNFHFSWKESLTVGFTALTTVTLMIKSFGRPHRLTSVYFEVFENLRTLLNALGQIGMAKYIEEYDNDGTGDYTKEKYEQPDYTIREILDMII